MNVINYDVVELLKEWGAWSCIDVGMGSLETPIHDNDCTINDDMGLLIDSAVAKLKRADSAKHEADKLRKLKRHSPRYRAIVLYYRHRQNIPMLAKSLKCGEDKAALVLKAAESFVECELDLY